MKRLFGLLILIIGGFSLTQPVFAEFSIGISPLTFEITANPGETIENHLKIYNPSPDSSIKIEMIIQDIAPTGEHGYIIPVEPAETETYSLARWIKCEPKEFDLKSKEEKIIKFTISVPGDAEPGGHYGTVIAGAKAVVGAGTTGVAIAPRVGSLVLLTVPGEMIEKITAQEFSVSSNYFEYGPIAFAAKFENLGTVHSRPSALITVTDLWGKKVAEIPLTQKNVLPGSVRKFESSWEQKWLFGGRYIATLSGTYGRADIPFEPQVLTFWAFPWKIALGLFIIIIFFIITRKRWATAFKVLVRGEKR